GSGLGLIRSPRLPTTNNPQDRPLSWWHVECSLRRGVDVRSWSEFVLVSMVAVMSACGFRTMDPTDDNQGKVVGSKSGKKSPKAGSTAPTTTQDPGTAGNPTPPPAPGEHL